MHNFPGSCLIAPFTFYDFVFCGFAYPDFVKALTKEKYLNNFNKFGFYLRRIIETEVRVLP